MRLLTIAIGWMFAMTVGAVELTDTIGAQEEMEAPIEQLADTVVAEPEQPKKKLGLIRRIIRGFDRLDERYIEPQHYVFAAMLQTTYNYERYSLSGGNQSITMKPDRNLRIGPYAGWKWVFLGYCFELGKLNFDDGRREFDFSMYSSQIGVDLFYRRTGSDYKLRNASLGANVDASPLNGQPFDGIRAGITGFNVYYIFNHGRFSYPAAFSQSTIQKISCGSWLAGVGYTRHSLEFDHNSLQTLINEKMGPKAVELDSALMFDNVRYYDVSLSGGYAYNWVFAKNWLLASSLQAALGYKRSYGDNSSGHSGFSFDNFNIDGIARFAVVYNNMNWYAGASSIFHTYNYRKTRFQTNNTFGSVNVYVGVNFGMKKKYRKKLSE